MRTPHFATRTLGLLLTAALLAGCQGLPVNLAQQAVKDRSQVDTSQGRRISAEATGFQLLLLIPIAVNGRFNNAYQELLTQAGGDPISDITITESWKWALVGTLYTTRLEATAYARSRPAGTPVPAKAGDGGTQ